MADEQATVDREQEKSAQRGSQSNPTARPETVRYSRADLADNAKQLLGPKVNRHVIAGALHDDDRETFTLDQAKKKVDAFLGREEERDNVAGDA
jgi:hypothetical protein